MSKLQDTQELHWSEVDGSCRNLKKYGLLLSKPLFSFTYDKLIYVRGRQSVPPQASKLRVDLRFEVLATNINFRFGQLFPVSKT